MVISTKITPPRIAESPVAFECERFMVLELNTDRALVLGRVVAMHVRDDCVLDAKRCYIDTPKLDLIGRIEARIGDAPVVMPDAPDAQRDGYLPVVVEGVYTGEVVHVLSSLRGAGPGSRVMAVLEATGGRRLVVDLPEGL